MVLEKKFGQMAAFKDNEITTVPIKEAISKFNLVDTGSYLVHTAKNIGIIFGDQL